MATRATKAVSAPSRGGRKGSKKAAKGTAKKTGTKKAAAKRGTFFQGPNSVNSSNPNKRALAALNRQAAKAAAKKPAKKPAKKAAKKR